MKYKLESLSIQELEALIQKTQELIERKQAQQEKLDGARAEIERIAREAGVSVDDLLKQVVQQRRGVSGSRKPVAAKYRNPADETQTWSGRGKRPRWLTDALTAGKSLEHFAV